MKLYTKAKNLSDYIISIANSTIPFVIAVDGFGGSGKSSLCKELSNLLPDAMTIQTDDFIKYPHKPNVFDHDWSAIESKVLKRLKKDTKVITKTYDWNALGPANEQHDVKHFVLVDGIGLLESKYIDYFDLKIWIDCPYEIALARGKKRDKEEQDIDHDLLWDKVWGPGSKLYFKRARPDLNADLLFRTYY
jgi:uridine kinase